MNRAFVSLAFIFVAGGGPYADSLSDGFSQGLVQQRFKELSPALCLLSYSVEITNPNSGEMASREATGLGVIVSPDGLMIAQGHMQIENRRPFNVKVTLPEDKRERDAVVLRKPDDVNIVFLKIEARDGETFPFIRFDDDVDLELAEPVMVFGLLKETLDHARGLQMYRVGAILSEPRTTYALDGNVPFGFACGPVITQSGKVAGIVGFDLATAEGGEIYTRSGHPLVYQSALFRKYIKTPPSEADAMSEDEGAWLGVFTQPLTNDLAEYWHLPQEGGVVVSTVIQGSPAERAGLRMGDVIVSFNGRPINAREDLDVLAFTRLVRESPLGQPLPLELLRAGEKLDMNLTLLPRPKSVRDAASYEDDVLGMTVRELTTDVRILLNLPDEIEGVIVRRVKSGSPAALAGIQPGFVILAIDQRVTTGLSQYSEAIEAEREARKSEIVLFCRIGANTAFFRVQPRWPAP